MERSDREEDPLFHLSSGYNGWSCANLKPGAQNFFWVSHMGPKAWGCPPMPSQATSKELDWKRGFQDYNGHPYGIPRMQAEDFAP